MLQNILELQGAQKLNNNQKRSINGGMLSAGSGCNNNGDAICCGTASWQCGTTQSEGGTFEGRYFNGNPVCVCF
ncbi:hypothetical protein [Aquimarina sp. SS2-1]|uniref:hypothetical protein n=1 Tax=Aquimarina besae TaxID=3342247 RepID=UPI00366E3600